MVGTARKARLCPPYDSLRAERAVASQKRKSVMAVTCKAGGRVPCVSSLPQQMEKDMATTIKISATSEQVREPTCELTEDQLEQVSGGIIAILIGLLLPSAGPSAPPSPTRHPV